VNRAKPGIGDKSECTTNWSSLAIGKKDGRNDGLADEDLARRLGIDVKMATWQKISHY
jgi:hypothetical protein